MGIMKKGGVLLMLAVLLLHPPIDTRTINDEHLGDDAARLADDPVQGPPVQGPPVQGPPAQGPPVQGPLVESNGYIEQEDCPERMYGETCSMQCPDNCEGNCDRNTGVCVNGCKKDGQFGERCHLFCCHCNFNHCLFDDGTCLDGINTSVVPCVDLYTTTAPNNESEIKTEPMSLYTTTAPNNESEIKTEPMSENYHEFHTIIGILVLVNVILLCTILLLLFGFSWLPLCLSSRIPVWYPKRGLVGLRRDRFERSRVTDDPKLLSDSNSSDISITTNSSCN